MVGMFLTQSEEDARRLAAIGARAEGVRVAGNLKYDVKAAGGSRVAERIKEAAGGRPIVVAGSTVERLRDGNLNEEEMLIQMWEGGARKETGALLVLAPRHPERFGLVESVVRGIAYAKASDWGSVGGGNAPFAKNEKDGPPGSVDGPHGTADGRIDVVLLDTIGDLAAVYGVADVAFVGGSLVRRGGHNPLEPARFGVPVAMGPSYENFREIVGKMRAADGIRIVQDKDELEAALVELLTNREEARAMGERGRRVFEGEQGATARAVEALVAMVKR
jgi:3-deoxy-D-manno-octulosonic-acid transferase